MVAPKTKSIRPAKFIRLDLPTTVEESESVILTRLRSAWARIHPQEDAPASDRMSELLDHLSGDAAKVDASVALRDRARRFYARRQEKLALLAHLKPDERRAVLAAARQAHAAGIVTRDEMEERIAALHDAYPWLAPASTAVMRHMRTRTLTGAAPFHVAPLILVGPPGIAKSSWARALARAFQAPAIDIDIGATNGGTFAISGTERGWGSASPGRVVSTMLREQIANPLVIVDEIDKIPEQVPTTKGGNLPGAFEVLKSMIEPSTAQNWTCPYHQIPLDLSGVSWVMTTNSIDHLPDAFLDRCKVVELGRPTEEQIVDVGQRMITARLDGEWRDLAAGLLRKNLQDRARHASISLRGVERLVERIQEAVSRPRLN